MKAIATIAGASMLAATSLTTTVTPADAGGKHWQKQHHGGPYFRGRGHRPHKHHHQRRHRSQGWNPGAAIVTGAILGLAFGALATPTYYPPAVHAYPPPQHPPYPYGVRTHASAQHVSWCYSQYKSYNANNNTWRGFDGIVRLCVSPY